MAIDPNIDMQLDEESGYALTEDAEMGGTPEPDPMMLASLGGVAGRRLAAIFNKSTRRTMAAVKKNKLARERGPSRADIDEMLKKHEERYGFEMDEDTAMRYQEEWEAQATPTEKRTPERINIERHIEGAKADINNVQRLIDNPIVAISQMETADDMAKLLEVAGRHQKLAEPPRTHASIKAETDDNSLEILKEALSIEGGGLLNDRQLHAARRMLATIGRQTVDFSRQIKAYKENGQYKDIPGDLLLAYQQSLEGFNTLHAFVKGQAREVARALAQQRMIAETLRGGGLEEIPSMVKAMGGKDDIVRHAELVADMEAGNEVSLIKNLYQKSSEFTRTGMGLAVEWWKSNILSGPQTHFVNMISNAATQTYEGLLVRGVAAGIGETRRLIGKAVGKNVTDRVSLNEYIAGNMAGMVGMADGLEAFVRTLRTGDSYFSDVGQYGGKSELVGVKGEWQKLGEAVGQKVGRGVSRLRGEMAGSAADQAAGNRGAGIGHALGTGATFSFRMLEAEDELFKVKAFREELTRLAIRDGLNKGLKGDGLTQHLDDVFADPEKYGLLKGAQDYARMMTFTDRDVGGLAGSLMDSARLLTENHPYLQFIIPFVRTPVNLVRYALENAGPTAILSKRMRDNLAAGGAARDIAMAKLSIGMSVTVGVYHMYQAGLITGSGPDDPAQRKLLEKAGWRESAVMLPDGNWYSYNRTDPFGTTLGAMADFLDRANHAADEETFRRYIMSAAFTIADHTFDATYMRGTNEMFQVMSGRRSAEAWLGNMAVPMVRPYAMAQKTVTKIMRGPERGATDEVNRSLTSEFEQRKRMFNPFLPEDEWPRPARYWDASPAIPREGEAGYQAGSDLLIFGLSPIQRRKAEEDPISQELAFNGVRAGEPSSMFTTPGSRTKVSLFALDNGKGRLYDEFFKMAGERRRKYIIGYLESSEYQRKKNTPGFRGDESISTGEMRSLIMQADREARDLFLYGKPGEKSVLHQLIYDKGMEATDFARQIANDYSGLDKDIYRGLVTQEEVRGQAEIKKRGAAGANIPMQAMPEADRDTGGQGPHF